MNVSSIQLSTCMKTSLQLFSRLTAAIQHHRVDFDADFVHILEVTNYGVTFHNVINNVVMNDAASQTYELEIGNHPTVMMVDGLVSPPITLTYGHGRRTYVFSSKVVLEI